MASITSNLLTAEAGLVHRLQCHDETALAEFYNQYASALFSMILRIVRDEEKAEDVFQESMMKIWRSVDRYEPSKGQLFTWASNISRNLAINASRRSHQISSADGHSKITDNLLNNKQSFPTKLNSLQTSLLRLFDRGMSDEEILDLRRVMVAHLSQKMLAEVAHIDIERGYTTEDYERMLNEPS
jgi:RNA polymerase sigma factor (sigma-70 family)